MVDMMPMKTMFRPLNLNFASRSPHREASSTVEQATVVATMKEFSRMLRR
jgi:hypothetical protein